MNNWVDFYNKFEGHPKYRSSVLIEDEKIGVIIQKIEMLVFSNKGDLWGEPDFGLDLERYLYETRVSASFVERQIRNGISDYVTELNDIGYDLTVSFMQNGERHEDIMLIDFVIDKYELNLFFS